VLKNVPGAPGAIPWLLLSTTNQKTGGHVLNDTTFIQRINTGGGVAPTDPCDANTNVGVTKEVSYTADYYFYKASSTPKKPGA
jgi:hypothetical protein